LKTLRLFYPFEPQTEKIRQFIPKMELFLQKYQFYLQMKKLIIAIAFIGSVMLCASCQKDRCPAHGGFGKTNTPVSNARQC